MKAKKNKIKNGLAVMVSGGRSSAMMAYHIYTSDLYKAYNVIFVFCNTSHERPETIKFLLKMVYHWGLPLVFLEGVYSQALGVGVKSKVVDMRTLKMDGSVFSDAIAQVNKFENKGVPNQAIPYCSDYLKTRVAHDYCRKYFGTTKYIKAIGYRFEDVPKRITFAELRADKKRIAPLLTDFEKPVGMLELNTFFASQNFKLLLHSKFGNCQLCFKKSTRLLVESIQFGTDFVEWTREMELQYGNMFFRDNMSIEDLILLAKSGYQLDMFSPLSDGCVCNF